MTIDLDATQITVYGRRKEGAARCRTGEMSYAPHIAFWAERGRALTAELVGGNQERLSGGACARIASRAIGLLADGTGRSRCGSTPRTTWWSCWSACARRTHASL